ncbi:hypothetical protein AB0M20_24590, partial [Actinoplanes sp. NPDC051633]|uniref:hypothetical protein n=1 Tax=Actinoplanes sp. NPDC051633 TaxID=3155670 RepID=UPI00343F7314
MKWSGGTGKGRLLRALRPRRGGRLPLALLAAACAIAVTAAVSDATAAPPGLRFAQIGHWIASPSQDSVFHVNGPSGSVDAEVEVQGLEQGSEVVQGDTSGYVVGRSTVTEFDKSSLSVESTMNLPTGEEPVTVEAKGGPYLVFREAGNVVRLGGGDPRTIPAGRGLGVPVVTPDGSLWLQRTDGNVICELEFDADRVSCPGNAPPGHTGALTVVGRQPVFVDTQNDTLNPVEEGGLGRPVKIGVDLPANARIATSDVDGRIAVVDDSARTLHLVDGAGAAAPLEVPLPDGEFDAPAAGRGSVVLLDRRGNKVHTYDGKGRPQQVTDVRPEAGEPHLSRGEDRRVYVDGGEGKHVLVVGDDGRAAQVPLVATRDQDQSRPPVPPPAEP